MAELQDLVSDRGYAKSSISRIKTFTESPDFGKASPIVLREKKARLVQVFKEYEDFNKLILRQNPDDGEDYNVYDEKFYSALAAIETALCNVVSSPASTSEGTSEFRSLPKINIKPFDGKDDLDYYPFINMFKSVIHSDSKLSLCEKLYYLRSFLTGEAYDVIKNLPLDNGNYRVALELLEKRYDNIPKVINHHVNSIMDLPPFFKCTSQNLRSLVSNVNLHLAALKNLNEPVDKWDTLLINILARKVDSYTTRGFYLERISKKVPTLIEFLDFLDKRAVALETVGDNCVVGSSNSKASVSAKPAKPLSGVVASKLSCPFCNQPHKLYECAKFKVVAEKERVAFIQSNKLCVICLNSHSGKCMLRIKCAICQEKHNTLAHLQSSSEQSNVATEKNAVVSMSSINRNNGVLLPTAVVRLIDKNGKFVYAKALLDSGSQVSFIIKDLAEKVVCDISQTNQLISGICEGTNSVSQKAELTIYSSMNEFNIAASCYVVKNITCQLPQQCFDTSNLNIPDHIKLADQKFNQTAPIGLLLGCNVFFQILQRESYTLAPAGPFLVNTSFGYVVAGNLPVSAGKVQSSYCCLTVEGNDSNNLAERIQESELHNANTDNIMMSNFWECEKVPNVFKEGSSEHQLAEECFQESIKLRNKRFSVALPLKLELNKVELGDSLCCAYQRLIHLEKRLSKDEYLNQKYKWFIKDYVDQGHARYYDMSNYDLNAGNVHFLPHHAVINPNSKTTPVRAVFDASAKTKNGLCLNDIMLNGPVVQNDLFDILTLFRTHKFVLLCDIKAMYRQIMVDEKYCCLQNILWREAPQDPLKCIQLRTVTYGLKSSAYLATRCLIELAQRFEDKYPSAAFVLRYLSYVDDIQCVANSVAELVQIKKELIELMDLASLSLHKWCSNHKEILSDIPAESQQLSAKDFDKNSSYIKTLGLTYDVITDTLNMKCPEADVQETYTKRQMLSFISKIFDPLGLLGPVIVQAKHLMQQVWFEDLKWDDRLPQALNKKWLDFAQGLVRMSCITVPRNINVEGSESVELIGFADASNIAYGCCLYLRVIDNDGKVHVNLLCSKSRINPKHVQLTVPRLELNSALILSMLARKVFDTLSLKYKVKTLLCLDSQIVLAWLRIAPVKLTVYVANRVEKIQQLSTGFKWGYVNTALNPADILSRGANPQTLQCENEDIHQMWFHGPSYLQDSNFNHCESKCDINNIPELKVASASVTQASVLCTSSNNIFSDLIERFSSLEKLTRVMAYIQRFVRNCNKNSTERLKGVLSPKELDSALLKLINIDQQRSFSSEINSLKNGVQFKSPIQNLNPFVDSAGLLRVGGRLQSSSLPFCTKHPLFLSKGSSLTKLIILNEHLRLKHAGLKLVLCSLHERYWLINGNRQIKAIIHKCVICHRLKAKASTQLMGSLPFDRVNVSRPFQIVGTDYAGPFYVKQTRIRRPVITKAYVVIFVCFVTKAVHIELASDMTTNTFLGCLKRFISRRNKPSKIYCDNAAYYKGANNVLKELYDLLHSTENQNVTANYCSTERIELHFIPSYSPVFGGLWEAGIKSIKYHMKRSIGNTVLTYEELYTVVVQIESILNSRPLTQMSTDVNDMSYLTPGHFLTGAALTSYPELNLVGESVGRLSFFKQCVQMTQSFWHQWQKQYLVMLQSRPKWKGEEPNLKIGAMVLVRENNVSPLNWLLGRIVNVYPGKDGKVRAMDVKLSKGTILRTSVSKLCPLPIEN